MQQPGNASKWHVALCFQWKVDSSQEGRNHVIRNKINIARGVGIGPGLWGKEILVGVHDGVCAAAEEDRAVNPIDQRWASRSSAYTARNAMLS
jgi:hypothetical protein